MKLLLRQFSSGVQSAQGAGARLKDRRRPQLTRCAMPTHINLRIASDPRLDRRAHEVGSLRSSQPGPSRRTPPTEHHQSEKTEAEQNY